MDLTWEWCISRGLLIVFLICIQFLIFRIMSKRRDRRLDERLKRMIKESEEGRIKEADYLSRMKL